MLVGAGGGGREVLGLCVCRSRDGRVYMHSSVREWSECEAIEEHLKRLDDTVECEMSW